MDRKYIAFISYRHKSKDLAVAKRLHSLIEQYRVPKALRKGGKKRLGIVFRDRDELAIAANLPEEIHRALDNSDFLIVICSPDTPHSPWVDQEIRHFLSNPRHDRRHILPLLIDGEPVDSYPEALVWDDEKQVPLEPLAADIRADSKHAMLSQLKKEMPRLYAAILNCSYDDLILREQKRKLRRIVTAGAAVLTVALGFSTMLLLKNHEIAQANTLLAQQKSETQQRESQLLARDAREALDSGDYRSAIRDAVSALSASGGTDRPYYAPAEQVLMEAMNLWTGADALPILNDTVLDQTTPVTDFALSSDGKAVATIDPYGVVHCFDAKDGALLWRVTSPASDSLLSSYANRVFFRKDDASVICVSQNAVSVYDCASGSLLWTKELSEGISNYLIFDAHLDSIAYIEKLYAQDYSSQSLELVVISCETGESTHRAPIMQAQSTSNCEFAGYDELSAGGTFSSDGKRFAGVFQEEGDDSRTLHCFVADLEQGTAEICLSQPLQDSEYYRDIIAMTFREAENALLIAIQGGVDTVAATVMKVDLDRNRLLWETTTPAEATDIFFDFGLNSYVLFGDSVLFAARSDYLYALDTQTGSILDSVKLKDKITNLETVSLYHFGFSLNDGTYAIGWCNSEGIQLTSDVMWQLSAYVGEHQQIDVYGGGIIQYYSDGESIEISISNIAMEGYLALVPAEEDHQVIIKRPVEIQTPLTYTQIPTSLSSITSLSNAYAIPCTDNTLILGIFHQFDRETADYTSHYLAVDTETMTVTRMFDVGDSYNEQYSFLPDGTGYILEDNDGRITCVADGKQTILSDQNETLAGKNEFFYSVRNAFCTSSGYQSGGDVLTAKCSTDTLTVWKNGGTPHQTALPEGLVHRPENDYSFQHFLKVGSNGFLLTGYYMEAPTLSDLAFYDTAGDQWLQIPGSTVFPNTSAFAISPTQPRFAAVDEQDMVRIYNILSGEVLNEFPLMLPNSCILNLQLILNDQYLLAKTQDAQVFLYEISTGNILCREQLNTAYDGTLRAIEDTVNQRLYIIDSNMDEDSNCLCLDMRSWTLLANVGNILHFDPDSGILYQRDPGVPLIYIRIPGTQELVELGQTILAME